MRELRDRLGRICDGWTYYDDEWTSLDADSDDFAPSYAHLGTFGGIGSRAVVSLERTGWHWRLYDPDAGTEPRGIAPTLGAAEKSAEDAAIEAGYRVPWREVTP
jgi:hypothetical protein